MRHLTSALTLLLVLVGFLFAAPAQAVDLAVAGGQSFAHAASGPTVVAVIGACSLIAAGTVIQLSAKDGDEETLITLNTEEDESQDLLSKVKQYAQLKVSQAKETLTEKLDAAQSENEELRSLLVSEILRIRKLSAGTDEDGDPDFDVEQEKEYLEGLPAERLKMEYQRLPDPEELSVESKTEGGGPDQENSDIFEEAEV